VACRDPGGTDLGNRLRAILLDRSSTEIGLRAEMLLYMASRAQMVDEVIRPALKEGAVVVSDRFLLSNVVYQGYAGGLDPEEIWSVGRSATGGLMPDLTLLLDVSPELASSRVGAPRDRIEDRPEAYRHRVRNGYLEAVKTLSTPYVLIDGSNQPDTVADQIRIEVAHALGIGPRP
jgi:dTMP kinase